MDLDLRQLNPEERTRELHRAFMALPPAHGLTFVTERGEPELLALLQQRFPGAFEWHPLQEGPNEWVTLLARRQEGSAPQRSTIEFMDADHRRIHELLVEIVAASRRGDCATILTCCDHLEISLRRHIQMEEELLLPVIALRLTSPRGPAMVLREEHLQILDLLARLQAAAGASCADRELLRSRAEQLSELLHNHSGMEERILYAITDLLLTPEERDALVRRCQAI